MSWPAEKGLDLQVLRLSSEGDLSHPLDLVLGVIHFFKKPFPKHLRSPPNFFRLPFWKGAAGSGGGSGRSAPRGRTGTWSWDPCACRASTGEGVSTPVVS